MAGSLCVETRFARQPGHNREQQRRALMTLFAKLAAYDDRSARLAGIGLMLLSIFMFSFGDAMGKFLVTD
jgi:hypothetical protein